MRAVFEIARHFGKGPITIKEISERQGISFSYLEQILHKLGKAGLIESVRGPAGGYLLGRKPQELTIGDIVRFGSTIAGVTDRVVLCVTPLTAGADIVGSVSWREIG